MPCARSSSGFSVRTDPDLFRFELQTAKAKFVLSRRCERSEAIHPAEQRKNGLFRCSRNDGRVLYTTSFQISNSTYSDVAARRDRAIQYSAGVSDGLQRH